MNELLQQLRLIAQKMWRHRWLGLLVAWLVGVVGWVGVSAIPDQYEAQAQVYVDTDSMLMPLLRGLAVETMDVSERLGMMTKALLSRPNLEKVIVDTDLDIYARTPEEKDQLIQQLSKNVHILARRTHRTPRPTPPNLYTIAARHTDPEMAYRIVSALLDIFVEGSKGGTSDDSDAASRFLDAEIAEYEERLLAAEARLREFKAKNIGSLPERGTSYFDRLRRAQESLAQVQLELSEEGNRRRELMRKLSGVEASGQGRGDEQVRQISPFDQRVIDLQRRLEELRLKYTDRHPDVIEVRNTLAELQDETGASDVADDGSTSRRPIGSDTAYQEMTVVLSEVEANIAALEVRLAEYTRRVKVLREQVVTLPEVEAQLTALNRDYEVTKGKYDKLIERREAMQLSQEMGRTGETVKLRVLEPPRVPLRPSEPNRLMLDAGVLLFAFAAGGGIAFLLSQISPVFAKARELREVMDLVVIGSIALRNGPGQQWRQTVSVIAYISAAGALIGAFGTVGYLHISGMELDTLMATIRGGA